MKPKSVDEKAVLKELPSVLDNKNHSMMILSVSEVYFLMQATQLTVTHPHLSRSMVQRMEAVGRRCQEAIRPWVSSLFAEFMEAGWHREFDK